jgi:hypothetical protein
MSFFSHPVFTWDSNIPNSISLWYLKEQKKNPNYDPCVLDVCSQRNETPFHIQSLRDPRSEEWQSAK